MGNQNDKKKRKSNMLCRKQNRTEQNKSIESDTEIENCNTIMRKKVQCALYLYLYLYYILFIHKWDKEDTLAALPSPSIVTQNKNKIKINDYYQKKKKKKKKKK